MNTYSGITVELVESHSHDLKNQLLEEKVDILVAHDFDTELFISYPLSDEMLLLAVPADFPINERFSDKKLLDEDVKNKSYLDKNCPTVDLSEFSNEEFLVLKKGNDMYTRTMQLCENAGFVPKVKIYPDQLLTAYNMARAGLGITIVTDNLLKAERGASKCVFYKLSGDNTRRKLAMGYKKKRYPSRAMEAFVQCAMDVYSGYRESKLSY